MLSYKKNIFKPVPEINSLSNPQGNFSVIFATFMKILALLGRSNLPLHEYAFLFPIGPLLRKLWSFKDTLLAENLFSTAGPAQNSLPPAPRRRFKGVRAGKLFKEVTSAPFRQEMLFNTNNHAVQLRTHCRYRNHV